MINLDELRKKAENAADGPWTFHKYDNLILDANGRLLGTICRSLGVSDEQRDDTSEFIAAANPAVVLELIAEIERLREEVAGWV